MVISCKHAGNCHGWYGLEGSTARDEQSLRGTETEVRKSYDYQLYGTDTFIIQMAMGLNGDSYLPLRAYGLGSLPLQHIRRWTERAEEAGDEDDEVSTLSNATREARLERRRGLHRILCVSAYLYKTHTHTLCHCIGSHAPDTHERIIRTEIREVSGEGVDEGGGCNECCVSVMVLHCHL
jgi:hypothetical protein